MSVMSRSIASQHRVRQINLTPWAAAAAGDLSAVDLPTGYRLMGDARRALGPYRLRLLRGNVELAEQWVTAAKDVPTWLQILSDLAALDQQQRGSYIVTVGPDDYIEDIRDE
jgi:hypothetical protein